MYQWQLDLLEKMQGKQASELIISMSGRRVGKSAFSAQALRRIMEDIYNRPVEDLILGESPIHGARYYTVQPQGGSWPDMEAWCIATFGEPGDMWESSDWVWPETARWMQNNRKFWFRNEADRTLFIMKWR